MEKRTREVLTAIKKREICAILAVGCSRTVAARYVGCHLSTIRRTALRNEEFAEALAQAESKHEIAHLSHINAAAKEGRYWRAAAWVLERAYPDRYGRQKPCTITVSQMSQALAQFADAILEEVTELEQQDRIYARLCEITAELQELAAKGARE